MALHQRLPMRLFLPALREHRQGCSRSHQPVLLHRVPHHMARCFPLVPESPVEAPVVVPVAVTTPPVSASRDGAGTDAGVPGWGASPAEPLPHEPSTRFRWLLRLPLGGTGRGSCHRPSPASAPLPGVLRPAAGYNALPVRGWVPVAQEGERWFLQLPGGLQPVRTLVPAPARRWQATATARRRSSDRLGEREMNPESGGESKGRS